MAALASQAAADEVPKRKPGLWEITTVAAGTGMTTITACIEAADQIVTPGESGECSPPSAERQGDTTIVNVVCRRGHGKQTMSTAFTGDFNSRYHAVMKISFDPPEGVRNMGVIIDGKYLGPDCAKRDGRNAPE
jgi:Protein of unknown function (DUF3617)